MGHMGRNAILPFDVRLVIQNIVLGSSQVHKSEGGEVKSSYSVEVFWERLIPKVLIAVHTGSKDCLLIAVY